VTASGEAIVIMQQLGILGRANYIHRMITKARPSGGWPGGRAGWFTP
jgi:hypothetical protein